ncbi:hypothetical protein CBR_g44421 [Chara braunii]|uniref:Retrotransposon gag domain-containing protein n=1 Tax=Chara braunii TaxID=69332 RepID=A0A388LXB6_CHABU|nr:hypothetical protein CBR_g44421 [Chara braunii]|eukprot:GBG86967.1 hypothetical protein CBR_g44421 [Chara braunii]
MAIVAASGSWKETRNEMMRKYLKAEKMTTETELAAVQRKNYATYNDFLRAFTLVALRIPGVTEWILSKYFLRQFSEFDKDKIMSAYQQTNKFEYTRDIDFSTVTNLAEKTVVTETLVLLTEGKVIDLTGKTGDTVKKGIESLHERVHGVDNKIETVENALLVMQAEVSRPSLPLQEVVVPAAVANRGYARKDPSNEQCRYCTMIGRFVEEAPEPQEQETEEAEAPQGVANLERIPRDLEDLEKTFADIRLSLPDREGGEVMRAPPETKLNFHALPVGKLKVQIETHHTDALVDGGPGKKKTARKTKMEFGNENDNNFINRPSGERGPRPTGEPSTKKRKLYVGFDFNLVVGRGGRKQGTRGPSPLREGEGIYVPSESESEGENTSRGKRQEPDKGESQGPIWEGAESGKQHVWHNDVCDERPHRHEREECEGECSPIRDGSSDENEEEPNEVIDINSGKEDEEVTRPVEEVR